MPVCCCHSLLARRHSFVMVGHLGKTTRKQRKAILARAIEKKAAKQKEYKAGSLLLVKTAKAKSAVSGFPGRMPAAAAHTRSSSSSSTNIPSHDRWDQEPYKKKSSGKRVAERIKELKEKVGPTAEELDELSVLRWRRAGGATQAKVRRVEFDRVSWN